MRRSRRPILAALKGLDDRGELTPWLVCIMSIVEPGFMFGTAAAAAVSTTLVTLHRWIRAPRDISRPMMGRLQRAAS
ncbi:hypothetical protein [Bradyrhizobium sp. sBnM-33]|uniref:hypothetical protein n=1 Tax=Bradyrhizobium sp. sBnM-33 TaxID=2831780 RepID=UPI001BCC1432|nr:hypothetical protein [Bradyrhizobium sp. sBnM-33]WOH53365.1 hypothetical protein RX328_15535 [Bradyrhizobium sp. sBnM-33]